MSYLEYLEKGHELINYAFNSNQILYNPNFYYSDEGRRNSEEAEKDIINALFSTNNEYRQLSNIDKKEYSSGRYWYNYYENIMYGFIVVIPVSYRHWFDIAIIDTDKTFYPVNLKITHGNTLDNLFGLMALKYLLFGYEFISEYGTQNITKVNSEVMFAEKILNSIEKSNTNREIIFKDFHNDYQGDNIRDYFFITVNKETDNYSISSYLNISNEYIKINPKNMFQAKISELNGINMNELDFEKNIIKIIYQFYDYARKKAEVFETLDKVLS